MSTSGPPPPFCPLSAISSLRGVCTRSDSQGSVIAGVVSDVTIAGVVALLPGLQLTTALNELALRHLASGSARMLGALTTSALFLVSYVTYHLHAGSRPFPGQGPIRVVYFAILITHVILAAVIVPLALLTAVRGLKSQFDKHVRIARWTFPVWLYVSVTGVVIYLMLYEIY